MKPLVSSSGAIFFLSFISQIRFLVSMTRKSGWFLPLLVLSCVLGSFCIFFHVENDGMFRRKERIIMVLWKEKVQFVEEKLNLKFQPAAKRFSYSDQVLLPFFGGDVLVLFWVEDGDYFLHDSSMIFIHG
ncbi:hypothetical protein KSP40_PGU014610 [Platanthera guangdongensis]|uniref:Uncharacterized protein n=1 Tax=Platanthera guangdongensis TaxID=2320717 RepID=A0ABR2MGW7_9ASPA